jgi:hypothetical protein
MLALGFISLPHTLTVLMVNLKSYSPPPGLSWCCNYNADFVGQDLL